MADSDIDAAYAGFLEDLSFEGSASGDTAETSFFNLYSALASENGDCVDLVYAPASRDGRGAHRIDGYSVDAERGVLYVAISDFRDGQELETLNSAQIDSSMQRIRRFIELAIEPSFLHTTQQSDPEFEAGFQMCQQASLIRRVRVILFSNARLSTRRPPEPAPEIAGRPVVYNFLDFARYTEIQKSRSSPEPVEVDLVGLNGSPLPCLPAFSQADEYEAYLVALPGQLLADIYGLYGARLLEQNVRTFLQAKTKVNKGILATIKDAPEMFFAYNNGLTAVPRQHQWHRFEVVI